MGAQKPSSNQERIQLLTYFILEGNLYQGVVHITQHQSQDTHMQKEENLHPDTL